MIGSMTLDDPFNKWPLLSPFLLIDWWLWWLLGSEGWSEWVYNIEYCPFHTKCLRWSWRDKPRRGQRLQRDSFYELESSSVFESRAVREDAQLLNRSEQRVIAYSPYIPISCKQSWSTTLFTTNPAISGIYTTVPMLESTDSIILLGTGSVWTRFCFLASRTVGSQPPDGITSSSACLTNLNMAVSKVIFWVKITRLYSLLESRHDSFHNMCL